MGRGEYISFVGTNGTAKQPPPPPPKPRMIDAGPSRPSGPPGQTVPSGPAMPPMPGSIDPMPMPPQRTKPWTDAQKQALTRTWGLSAIGSVAGAVLWKEHRVWGFILGGMAGGGVGKVIFAPRDPLCDVLDRYR